MRGMAKAQIGARLDEEVLDLARRRAADRNQSVGDYLTQLVLDGARGLRDRAMAAAGRFIDEFGSLFDEAEEALGKDGSGAHAA